MTEQSNIIKVYLDDKLIEYPKEYNECVDEENLIERIRKLQLDETDYFKNRIKLFKEIENKNKKGTYIYINGYATKHWQRFGYNHYTTKINNRELTLIYTDFQFGKEIPLEVLEKTLKEIYKKINILKKEELFNYFNDISTNGIECDYLQTHFYNRKYETSIKIINNMKLNKYLNNEVNLTYNIFKIPKKKAGYRTIESPNDDLKEAQRLILDLILKNIEISLCATGFIEGKSIINNASKHVGKKFVLNLDLKDFFPSIQAHRIYSMFLTSGISHKYSVKLATLCTNKGSLPQGSPCSPYISNIICFNLDRRLNSLCKSMNADYTRYADDLTISTDNSEIKNYIKTIEGIINEEGFNVNYKKLRLLSNNTKQVVTGIVVNEKLNIDRNYIRKIRQELYYCEKHGINQHMLYEDIDITEKEYINKLKGKINFIKDINYKVGMELDSKLSLIQCNQKIDY